MNLRQRLTTALHTPPSLANARFIAPNATIIGQVELAPDVSIFYGAVLRGDINHIRVGARSNIQDNAVLHVSDAFGVHIEEEVTVGHLACIHACTIHAGALIGMHATIMDGASIGSEALVAAAALVPPGMHIPDGMLAAGLPAKIIRPLTPDERRAHRALAHKYLEVAKHHREKGDTRASKPET